MRDLESLWRRQLAFTQLLLSTVDVPLEQLTDDDRVRLTKEYIEYLHSELVEVLNNVPWKKHRYLGAANREDLLEELVDCQKFLWGLMMIWGVTPGELSRAFDRKSDVVDQRFAQEHLLPKQVSNKKVVIVDIDGVVANWKAGFTRWVLKECPDLNSDDFAKHVDPGLRQQLKDKMHSSGGMLDLMLLARAREAIGRLVDQGYTIIWLTARPVSRHPRLMADTVTWLKKAGLPHEYVYWSDLNKHLFILQKFPVAAAFFDDKPELVTQAQEFGVKAYLVNQTNELWDQVYEFFKSEESE
jgi:hypothetical protein